MSRHDRSARSGTDRTNLYDEITTKIIGELEASRVPWVQPWGTAATKAPLAMPKNAATGRQYSGINVLILWGSVIERGFPVQGWVTFRQRYRSAAMSVRASTAPPSSMPIVSFPTTRRSGHAKPARKRKRSHS
jgi:antirestriction protein ArdC